MQDCYCIMACGEIFSYQLPEKIPQPIATTIAIAISIIASEIRNIKSMYSAAHAKDVRIERT